MGQFISFKSEINNPWFNPWFILLHTHSNMCATVEGRCLEYLVCMYNFDWHPRNFGPSDGPGTNRRTASTVLIQNRRRVWKSRGTSRNSRHFEGEGFASISGKIWVPLSPPSSSDGPVLCETCGLSLGCLISRIHKTGGKYGSPSRVWTVLKMGLILGGYYVAS